MLRVQGVVTVGGAAVRITAPEEYVVTLYATSGALASSRDALLVRADSDLRAYRPCHRRDGTVGTPELIYGCCHRRASSLAVMTVWQ